MVDVLKGMAQGKSLDLEDARNILSNNYDIRGTDDIAQIKGSDIVVVTAGLARKPGMTREELLQKNAAILRDVCLNVRKLAPESVLVIVTNPLDLMTYYALKITGFKANRVLGMGVTLDASRFANLIAKELQAAPSDIMATVIGSHGEGMLPLARFTTVKGISLEELMDTQKSDSLVKRTIARGQEIVTLLGSGSAYFAPSAAAAQIVRCIAKDEKKTLGVSAYLSGEYGIKDVCIGVPCRIGREGIEKIVELDLNSEEKKAFGASAENIRLLLNQLPV
jgi:malate dehydrogenase